MATLISAADGNFTSSSTWKVADTTSFLDSIASSTSVVITPSNSSNFTPGAITIEGIAVQVVRRNSSVGTITVSLWNSTAATQVAGTDVTINISDIPDTFSTSNSRGVGWVYFKFSSPVTLLAATAYAVRVSSSVNSSVTLWSSTGTNFSRALITSTAAAPSSTDILIITGEHTSAGVNATRTVTMNNTTTTAFGQTYVSVKGILSYGVASSTSYNLRLTGNLFVTSEGTLNIGTSGTPIPNNSTAVLEFNVSTSGQFGLIVSGGTFNAYGQPKTKFVRLAADSTATSTNLTLSTIPTNWLSSDTIGITSTTTNSNQAEIRILSTNVTTTTATITSGLTNDHGGNSTTLVQAHVCNLTRNVIIRSVSSTIPAYSSYSGVNTVVDISNVLYSMIGSTTLSTSAISLFSATSRNVSFTMTNSVIYQPTATSAFGIYMNPAASLTSPVSYNITDNVIWNIQGTALQLTNSVELTTKTLTGNLFAKCSGITIYDFSADTSNNVFTNSSSGGPQLLFDDDSLPLTGTVSPLTGLESYGNPTNGLSISNTSTAIITAVVTGKLQINLNNITTWRNSTGFNLSQIEIPNQLSVITFNNAKSFGNSSENIKLGSIANSSIIFNNSNFWGGTGIVSTNCISGSNLGIGESVESVLFNNCTFGVDYLGNTSTFSGVIISLPTLRTAENIVLFNPTMAGTIASSFNNMPNSSGYSPGIIIQKLNGVTGSDFIYTNSVTISRDSTIFRTVSHSTRLSPSIGIGVQAPSSTVRVPVKSGQTTTISVWVRKSTAGDGTAYNGGQPTLVMRPNLAAGNLNNTTVSTMTSSAGVWENLTYTTGIIPYDTVLEFIVVFDGDTGWINIDEWNTTSNNDTRSYFIQSSIIGQYVDPYFNAGGGSFTFIS
jgi:hypothetical protein